MTATLESTRNRTGRVAVIGAGGIGRAHAQAAAGRDGATLVAIADIDAAAAGSVADEHGAAVAGITELADPDLVDLVVVASPPSTHPAVVEPLLRAGVPVLCEKPIAIDGPSADHLALVAGETGTPLTMATKFRFVDDVARTRGLIEAGDLGEIVKVEVAFAGRAEMRGRWNSDRAVAGGGVLIDNATHGVDLVRYLVGDITEVFAVTGPATQDIDVEDSATLLAKTAHGALAQVDVTWSFRRLSPVYCAVYGNAGSVEIGWQGATGCTIGSPEPFRFGTGYRKIDSLRDNLSSVLAAILSRTALPVSTADAVASVSVIEAGYESAASGRWTHVRTA